MNDTEIKNLAKKHWEWVEGLLDSMPLMKINDISMLKYLYTTAFVHGYKHATQQLDEADANNKRS